MGVFVKAIEYPTQDIVQNLFGSNVVPKWEVVDSDGTNETIEIPQFSDVQLEAAYSTYLAALPPADPIEAIKTQVDLATTEEEAIFMARPSLFQGSGRIRMDEDGDWMTGADDVYGYNQPSQQESAGRGSTPDIEWEHMGILVPAGRRLGTFFIAGRSNNLDVEDIDLYIGVKFPDPVSRWESGIDNDNEVNFQVLYDDRFLLPSVGDPFTGKMNDLHKRRIALDYTLPEDGMFIFYARPVFKDDDDAWFYHSWTLEVY